MTPRSAHDTGIGWTHADGYRGTTWNPVRGCSLRGPGCLNCYAMHQAMRMSGPGDAYDGLVKIGTRGPIWTGVVREAPEHVLLKPLQWTKPRMIFVNSMSDLFHEGFAWDVIDRVFDVMLSQRCSQHIFQVLTKREDRMLEYCSRPEIVRRLATRPNVWLGASVENQDAVQRVRAVAALPAWVRMLSIEPQLESVTIPSQFAGQIDWMITGGESGDRARRYDVEWASEIVNQARALGAAPFVKQVGSQAYLGGDRFRTLSSKGDDPSEWPERIQVQEWPSLKAEGRFAA